MQVMSAKLPDRFTTIITERNKRTVHAAKKIKISFVFTAILSIAFLIIIPASLQAYVFSVSNVTELETALATAADNGVDDIIHIADGTYSLTSSLNFDSQEDYSITLQGEGNNVILDGGAISRRILFMRTTRSSADITIKQIIFENGYAPEGDNGAGLFVNINSAKLTLENVHIVNCYSAAFYFTNHGGGAYITAGVGADVIIRNSVIAGNGAKGNGGGLYLSLISGTLSFINNTVVNNTNNTSVVEGGGGVYLRLFYDTAQADLYNNIFWNNSISHGDGDIYIEDNGDSVLDENEIPATVNMYNNNYKQLDFNLGTALTLLSNSSLDPMLSADFHLAAASPCVDAGTPDAPDIAPLDFEGDPRSFDGDRNGSALPDLGADEYEPPIPGGDVNCDHAVDIQDVVLGLQELTNDTSGTVCIYGDVDGDLRVGMAEIIYALNEITEGTN